MEDSARLKRGQLEIMAAILTIACGKGATKTSLVYKANLNFNMGKKYIALLMSKDLLERVEASTPALYRTTEKGSKALEAIMAAENLVLKKAI